MVDLKQRYFPRLDRWQFEIKSEDIRRTLDPNPKVPPVWPWSSIDMDKVRDFFDEAFEFAKTGLFWLWFVVIDKYGAKAHNPYHLAFAFLLKRAELFLRDKCAAHEFGIMVADETKEVEAGRNTFRWAIDFIPKYSPQPVKFERIVEAPFFIKSEDYHAIQLVDLYVHEVYQAYRTDNPEYLYFRKLEPALHPNPKVEGVYGGSGLILFPENKESRLWAASYTPKKLKR